MNDSLIVKYKTDDFEVDYDITSLQLIQEEYGLSKNKSPEISSLDELIDANEQTIEKLNHDIYNLTNHADKWDYIVAVSSGIITGLVDSFIIGKFTFVSEEGKPDAYKQTNEFIEKYAKLRGYKGDGLNGAISFLEKKFPVDQDNLFSGKHYSSTKLHHLEDLAHHPTPLGLLSAVIVKFIRVATFVNKDGKWTFDIADTNPKQLAKIWLPIILSAFLSWLVNIAETKYSEKSQKETPKPIKAILGLMAKAPAIIEVLKVADNWFGHLVSDMGGSKNTPGKGQGIPGLMVSLLKELSSLPFLKDTGLPAAVSDMYSKEKINFRTENDFVNLKRQAVPVLINEGIVRIFYFVRHLAIEKGEKENWKDVNWHNVIPFGNRTVVRMMTISTGTMTTIDIADAAIRSSIENGANVYNPKLYIDFVMRINIVGIGRLFLSVGEDVYMGHSRKYKILEKLNLQNKVLMLHDAKIFYLQQGSWEEAKNTMSEIAKLEEVAALSMVIYMKKTEELYENWNVVENSDFFDLSQNDPEFKNKMLDYLN